MRSMRMANVVGQLMLFFYKHEDFSYCEAKKLRPSVLPTGNIKILPRIIKKGKCLFLNKKGIGPPGHVFLC